MNMITIDQQVSVSGQITVEDVAVLTDSGVEIIICNRPDNESVNQPAFAAIETAAKAAGIDIINIPFVSGDMQPHQVTTCAELLATGKRIHLYCRTGNRSSQLWSAAQKIL